MIRGWSDDKIVISHPPLRRPYSSDLGDDFVLKNTTFRTPAISQNVTKCCACHENSHSNFTKYCACHAKWISWLIHVTYETSFTMRGASTVSLSKYCACHEICKFKLSAETPWIASANRKTIRTDPRIIRGWSEDDPTIKSSSRTRRFGDLTRPILETILYWKIQHFALRLSPKMSPNAAPATKTHTPTSPNTAPATQNESHDWSTSHMKRHLQCAEQAQSASNLTKYCACHEICKFKLSAETPWIASANRKTIRTDPRIIRGWSDDKIVISHPPLRRPYSSDLGDDFVLKNTTFRAPAISQNVTKCCACHENSHSNFTKYCACHLFSLLSLGIYSL